MKFLLLPGTRSTSNWSDSFWNNSTLGVVTSLSGKQSSISGRSHCTTMWQPGEYGFPQLSLTGGFWVRTKKRRILHQKDTFQISPYQKDEQSRGYLPNFSKCLFILTCVWISCAYMKYFLRIYIKGKHQKNPT